MSKRLRRCQVFFAEEERAENLYMAEANGSRSVWLVVVVEGEEVVGGVCC